MSCEIKNLTKKHFQLVKSSMLSIYDIHAWPLKKMSHDYGENALLADSAWKTGSLTRKDGTSKC